MSGGMTNAQYTQIHQAEAFKFMVEGARLDLWFSAHLIGRIHLRRGYGGQV